MTITELEKYERMKECQKERKIMVEELGQGPAVPAKGMRILTETWELEELIKQSEGRSFSYMLWGIDARACKVSRVRLSGLKTEKFLHICS